MSMRHRVLFVMLLLALPACSRCSSTTPGATDAGTDAATETKVLNVDVLPPPAAWKFEPVQLGPMFSGVALPSGCTTREPIVRAKVKSSTKFVAVPKALSTLVIADADVAETPPRLLGVAAMTLDPAGTSTNPVALPWTDAAAMPRIGRTNAGLWLAAYAEPAAGKLSEVFVVQNKQATSLGVGDKFEAVDLSCLDDTCLLLTTRLSQVSAAGADVWMGKPFGSATSWLRREIVPSAGDSDARPSTIARLDATWTNAAGGTSKGHVVTLFENNELVFWGIGEDGKPEDLGKLAALHGIIDATMLGRPVAFVYGAPIDDEGCAQEGGVMRFSRLGATDIEFRTPAPATTGTLRPLARGGLATYVAPLGCGAARKVAYAVVLADDGTPVSQPMPLTDATSLAVTTEGEKVDLFVQRDEEVLWVRATCAAP